MNETPREQRAAELRNLQRSDPRALINRYCEITGRYNGNQLPHQTSFTHMIGAIVDFECGPERPYSDTFAAGGDKMSPVCPPTIPQQPPT